MDEITLLAGGLLTLLIVSAALAAVPGDSFKLGLSRTINALTTLTGSVTRFNIDDREVFHYSAEQND